MIAPNPDNTKEGYIQKNGKFAGYFVSKTTLEASSNVNETDPAKYVDATTVPYLVFPGNFYRLEGSGEMGDYGLAINLKTGKSSPFIVADVGPSKAALGEVSIALAASLGGINPNPRSGKGKPEGAVAYIVFPHSRIKPFWPLSSETIDSRVKSLLESVGGYEKMLKCATSSL